MWSPPSTWACHSVEFDGDVVDPDRSTGPWSGHRDFAYDLIQWRQPESVVELGTHYGVSLFAICQALRDAGATAAVHAIDTWAGDEHAGFYGDEVFEFFQANLESLGYQNVRLHRCLFAEAIADFADGSVDLIHIDGLHTYEALKEDFESWMPKLAPNGLMLLHDIAPSSGYGSARFFAESILDKYPTREFGHNFGLGVVLPNGTAGWEFILSDEWARWAVLYERSASARTYGRMAMDQAAMIDSRDEALRAQTRLIDERDEALRAQTRLIDERDEALRAQTRLIDERDHHIEQLEWEVSSRDSALAQAERRLRTAESELLRIRDRAEYLEWLDVSPRLQLKALSRSVPKGVAKRARSARRRLRAQAASDLKEPDLSGSLRDVVERHFDPLWYSEAHGCAVADSRTHYEEFGLAAGLAVSASHAALLDEERSRLANETRAPSFQLIDPGGDRIARGSLSSLVRRMQPQLVTVDLWDTLVVRVRPADAAKAATARRMLMLAGTLPSLRGRTSFGLLEQRVGIEREIASESNHQEYLIDKVLERQLDRLGMQSPAARTTWVGLLREAEIHDEVRNSLPVREVADHLLANPSWVVMSDFYMSDVDLRAVLEGVLGQSIPNRIVSSATEGASKRSGDLYERVRAEENCPPEKHLHIGDNLHSDVEQAQVGGGWAVHVEIPQTHDRPGSYGPASVSDAVQTLMDRIEAMGGDPTPAHDAGRRCSPLAVAVVDRALAEARSRGLDRVHYVSREGLFLLQVHRVLEPLLRFGPLTGVVPVHLAVSRRSTFGASVCEPLELNLHRMWSMYGTQTPRALLLSLGLVPEALADEVTTHGLKMDEPVVGVAQDARVRAFLEDRRVRHVVLDACSRQREELIAYLSSVTDLDRPWVIVDVGWRGTIQDNLAHATSVPSLVGVYFGLFPFLNPQPSNTVKIGVGFDGNTGDDYGFAEPPAALERPWTVDAPSTIGYRRAGDRIEMIQHAETGHVSPWISEFQAGVLEAAPVVAEWMTSFGLDSDALGPTLHQLARAYWISPIPAIADIWFDSEHDDSFGALNQTTFGKLRPDQSWLDGRFGGHLARGEAHSGWSQGYRSWRPVRALMTLFEMGEPGR